MVLLFMRLKKHTRVSLMRRDLRLIDVLISDCRLYQHILIFCLLPSQAVHRIQAGGFVPVEIPHSDLVHLAVLEVGNRREHPGVGSENSEESHLAEGRACRPEDSEVGHHLVGKEEMAYRDRQGEEGRLAYQTVEEACLFTLEKSRKSLLGLLYLGVLQEMGVESRPCQLEVVA